MRKSLSLIIFSGILLFLFVLMPKNFASASTIVDVTESTTESTITSSGITSGNSSNSSSNSSSLYSSSSSESTGSNSGSSSGNSGSGVSSGSTSSDGEIYIDENGKLQVTSTVTTEGLFTRIQNKLIEAFTGTRGAALVIIVIIFVIVAVALTISVLGDRKRMGGYIVGLLVCLIAFVLVMYAPEISVAFSNWITTD